MVLEGLLERELTLERDYFARNAERMRYKAFQDRGLPIGSGAVESAVRQMSASQRLPTITAH